jgi:hypothetical protein
MIGGGVWLLPLERIEDVSVTTPNSACEAALALLSLCG